MYEVRKRLKSGKGKLAVGLRDENTILKVLSKEELEEQIDCGNIVKIEIPNTADIAKQTSAKQTSAKQTEMTIEELLDVEDKSTLKVAELRKVAAHYKVDASGNKDALVENINAFEALLDTDELSTLSENEVNKIADYYAIDASLPREGKEMAIDALED